MRKKPTDSLVRWGARNLKVHSKVAAALNSIREVDRAAFGMLWQGLTQGQGSAAASGVTHKNGFAVDFSVRGAAWDETSTLIVLQHLDRVGFAAVLRYAGELGPGNPAHIHAALRPYSNSRAVDNVNRSGRTFHIMVAREWGNRALAG